jgi:4-hydroxybenzoyl-CoA thioesterase
MEFVAPVRYGDHVDVGVVIEHVGQSSVRIRYSGSVDGRPVFLARNTVVWVDMKTFTPTPVPGWLRERFQAAMEPSTASR